jgi:hypothetical protein
VRGNQVQRGNTCEEFVMPGPARSFQGLQGALR